jgi:inhibitor of KinA sporulation pathway (predicted exonuclease)
MRPINEPTLSAFCMGLTGIRQEEIDGAEDFSIVFRKFLKWIGREPYRFCSWGDFDLKQFKTDCARHQIPFPRQFSDHLNLKHEFARLEGIHPCGVKRAFALAHLQPAGRAHRALDDTRNIARLAVKMILPRLRQRPD